MSKKLYGLVAVLALVGSVWSLGPATAKENVFSVMESQVGASWGLDRIDGTVDGTYTYSESGAGVRVYIVDTGVDASHPDFAGRVIDGFDAFNQNLDQSDCHGHGTHVGGIVAGSKYGVAKLATIVPVRVLNCSGQGNTTTLTDGINWIIANHPAGVPAIVNMSLGGPKDLLVNAVTTRLVDSGAIVITAAGNSSSDSCSFSPASATGVIAVGATNPENIRSPFSNWGDCVDIFAPGSRIDSNIPRNYSGVSQKSGTSQAAAFVSGVVATYISGGVIESALSAMPALDEFSEKQAVSDAKSVKSNLVNVARESTAPVVAPVVPEVPSVSVSDIGAPRNFSIKYNKLSWNRPTYSGSYASVTYIIQQFVSDKWVTLAETRNTNYSLPRNSSSSSAVYRVAAKIVSGIGPFSKEIRNVGATAANLITPITEVPLATSANVTAKQRGGAGSAVGDLSWTPVSGVIKYEIESSVFGSQSWSLLRSTTGTSIKFITRVGVPVSFRVVAVNSDGTRSTLGVVDYVGAP